MWKFQIESKNILIKILHDLEGQQNKSSKNLKDEEREREREMKQKI